MTIQSLSQRKWFAGFEIQILFVAVIFLWGVAWPVTKIALREISPIWLVVFRLSVACFFVFFIALYNKKLYFPEKKYWPIITTVSFFQISLFLICVNVGLEYIDPGRAAILAYTTPFFAVPIAALHFKERLSTKQWLGLLLGGIGVILLIIEGVPIGNFDRQLFGNALLVIAAISTSIALLHIRFSHLDSDPMLTIFWQLFLSLVTTTLTAVILEPHPLLHWSSTLIVCIVFLGLFCTAFVYFAMLIVAKKLSTTETSMGLLGIPAVGFLSSDWWFGETLTLSLLLSTVAIFGGLLMVLMRANPLHK